MGSRQRGAQIYCELNCSVFLRAFHLEIAAAAQSTDMHPVNGSLAKCCRG